MSPKWGVHEDKWIGFEKIIAKIKNEEERERLMGGSARWIVSTIPMYWGEDGDHYVSPDLGYGGNASDLLHEINVLMSIVRKANRHGKETTPSS